MAPASTTRVSTTHRRGAAGLSASSSFLALQLLLLPSAFLGLQVGRNVATHQQGLREVSRRRGPAVGCPFHRRRRSPPMSMSSTVDALASQQQQQQQQQQHQHLSRSMPPWESSIATALATSSSSSSSSVASSAPNLLFMDFYKWQRRVLTEELGATPLAVPDELSLAVNEAKGARIASECFETEAFRRVRMTYFDAGDKIQVFNSLWYPRYDHDGKKLTEKEAAEGAPLLGIDLLCFGTQKLLAVVDCQPVAAGRRREQTSPISDSSGAPNKFAEVRSRYPSLCGEMSGRYYDDGHFFSDAMLFGRLDDAALVQQDLLPAYKEYLREYLALMHPQPPSIRGGGGESSSRSESSESSSSESSSSSGGGRRQAAAAVEEAVRGQQAAYDQYSADRDPAHGLFKSYFGEEWADDFIHQFLFTLADPAVTVHNPPNFGQGAHSQGKPQGNPQAGKNPFA